MPADTSRSTDVGECADAVMRRFTEILSSCDLYGQVAALIAGECDVGPGGALRAGGLRFLQKARDKGLIDYHAVAGTVWEHFDMNVWPWDGRHPWFARKEVRQAVAYGTDRQQMTDEILFGETEPMQSWIPADSWAFNPDVKQCAYDPDMALAMLASTGFEDRDGDGVVEAYGYSGTFPDGTEWSIPDGTPFEVSFNSTMGNSLRETLLQIFQPNMADIGIQVNLDLMPGSIYFADDGPLFQRKFDIKSERIPLYHAQQEIYVEEVPTLPLFQRVLITGFAPNLRGWVIGPSNLVTWNIHEWYSEGE